VKEIACVFVSQNLRKGNDDSQISQEFLLAYANRNEGPSE